VETATKAESAHVRPSEDFLRSSAEDEVRPDSDGTPSWDSKIYEAALTKWIPLLSKVPLKNKFLSPEK
jgi:hypothetical protein